MNMMQQEKYDNDTHHDHGNKHMKHTTTTKLNGRHLDRRSRGVTPQCPWAYGWGHPYEF